MGAILLVLGMAVCVALVFQRLGASTLVAYLITGCIAGPSMLALVDGALLQPVADIGASLLLFTLGLELDVRELRRSLRPVLIGALGQVGLTVAAGALIGWLLGLDTGSATAVGACLAMTSTVMLLKALEERRLKHRPEGRLCISISLAQDVSVGPLLILLSLLMPVGQRTPAWQLLIALAVLVAATVALRSFMASRLIARLRQAKMPELEVAFALAVALGSAALCDHAGLGAAAGAFAAGMALGGEHRAIIESSVRQFQGLTAMLFFAAMGALLDVRFALTHWWEVLGGVVIALAIKAPIAAFAVRIAGLPIRSALGCGLVLAPIGEFSFILAAAALGGSSDPAIQHLYQLVVAITCVSLAATPLIVWIASPLLPTSRLSDLDHHGDSIVVAGLGPVGNAVVETLRNLGYPLLLVDRNAHLLAPWRNVEGIRCHQGRIEDMEDWLPILGHRPVAVVLTFPVPDASVMVATRLRAVAPDLLLVARSPYLAQVASLHQAGVQHVICDETETAKALVPLLDAAIGGRSTRPTITMDTLRASLPLPDKAPPP